MMHDKFILVSGMTSTSRRRKTEPVTDDQLKGDTDIYEPEIKQTSETVKKEEHKLLNTKENSIFKATIEPVADKLQSYIPDKLKTTLEAAFYKGFWLVFEKGHIYIEKTYDKDKIQLKYDLNNYAIDKSGERKYRKRLDRYAKQSQLINSSISILEGGALGAFGIGLPDIPLLICTAMTKQERQKEFYQKLEKLGDSIDYNRIAETILEEPMKTTASILSEALLTAKFIQGIPLVGAVGGIVNYNIIRKISKFAGIKYKMRYYMNKQRT